MKTKKCEKCGELIDYDKIAFISNKHTNFKNKQVCQRCFMQLKNKKYLSNEKLRNKYLSYLRGK